MEESGTKTKSRVISSYMMTHIYGRKPDGLRNLPLSLAVSIFAKRGFRSHVSVNGTSRGLLLAFANIRQLDERRPGTLA